jgi:hypothetical protein
MAREKKQVIGGVTEQEFENLLSRVMQMQRQKRYEAFASLTGTLPDADDIRDDVLALTKQIIDYEDATVGGVIKSRQAELEARNNMLKYIADMVNAELSASSRIQAAQIGAKGDAAGAYLKEVGLDRRLKSLEMPKGASDDIQAFLLKRNGQVATGTSVELEPQAELEQEFVKVLTDNPQQMGKMLRYVQDNAKRPGMQSALTNILERHPSIKAEAQRQNIALEEEYRQADDILQEANARLAEDLAKGGVSGTARFRAMFQMMDKLMPGSLDSQGNLVLDVEKMRENLPRDENGEIPAIVALESQLSDLMNNPTYEGLREGLTEDPAFVRYKQENGYPDDRTALKGLRKELRRNYRDVRRQGRIAMRAKFGKPTARDQKFQPWEYDFLGPPERDEDPKVDPTAGATKAAQATEGSGAQEATMGPGTTRPARKKAKEEAKLDELYPEKDIYGAFQDSSDVSPVESKAEAQERVKADVEAVTTASGMLIEPSYRAYTQARAGSLARGPRGQRRVDPFPTDTGSTRATLPSLPTEKELRDKKTLEGLRAAGKKSAQDVARRELEKRLRGRTLNTLDSETVQKDFPQ